MAQTISIGGTTHALSELQSDAIPLLVVDTERGEEPTFEQTEAPEGYWGTGIKNATKVPGRLVMTLKGDTIYDSGAYEKKASGITLKVSGNTSASQEQTPYKIKLQKKADLLCRPNSKKYRDKDFVLLSSDRMNTKVMVGLMVNELMNLGWTPAWRMVNVVVNSRYRGLYVLCESVERNPDCRINVDEKTGFIVENDAYWWNEDFYIDNSINYHTNYTLKYPDPEDITTEQTASLTAQMATMEQSIVDGTYTETIDPDSWARWLLGHDLLGDIDAGGSNMFLYKYDDKPESRFKMGPLWDFDNIEHNKCVGNWAKIHTDRYAFVFPLLLESSNKAFTEAYQTAWNAMADTLLTAISKRLDDYTLSNEAKEADRFMGFRKTITGYGEQPISSEMEAHKQWFAERVEWLSKAAEGMNETSVSRPSMAKEHAKPAIYQLSGQAVDASKARGVVVKDGKKIIMR